MFPPNTPRNLTPAIREFTEQLAGGGPVYLSVEPRPDSDPLECFANVERAIRDAGGDCQYGWIIWELPGIFLEAEHHAVWSVEGRLSDVTPQRGDEESILFLPDSRATYAGTTRPNVRKALSSDPLVAQYLEIAQRGDALKRTYQGRIPADEYAAATRTGDHGFWLAFGRLVVANRSRNDPCVCGSRRKFKRCCWRTLPARLDRLA